MDYTKIENIKEWLKANLNDERYRHSLGTADCAKEMAEKFGVNQEKAYFCGLIHDCAKCLPNEEQKKYMCECLELCEGESSNPKTFHAPAGKVLAQKEFGITDEEILSAIRWHTLGKTKMSDFEKIIFIADKIEHETRPDDWAEPIREVLNEENGLNKALLLCYKNTIKSLTDRNLKICKTTIDIYNHLLDNI